MVKVLEVNDLTYKDFKKINLSFEDNKYYVITGSNQCGKTTLFKLLTSLILTKNVIVFNHKLLNKQTRFDYLKYIGIVKKVNDNSFLFSTVLEEMEYPLINLNYSKKKRLQRIEEILNIFNEGDLIHRKICGLRREEKQKLLIMIALLHNPKILFLDDVLYNQKDLLDKLRMINLTIINFTTNLNEAINCDEIIILDKFQIINKVSSKEMLTNDQLFYNHNIEIPLLYDLESKLMTYEVIDKEYISIKDLVDGIWH